MTALRPEHDPGQDGPYEHHAYEATGAFEAAVEQLADPLNDPLPGQHASPWFPAEDPPAQGAATGVAQGGQAQASQGAQEPQGAPREWYDPEGYERDWYGQQEPVTASSPQPLSLHDETVGLRSADTRRMADRAVTPPAPAPRPESETAYVPEYAPEPDVDSTAAAADSRPESAEPGPRTDSPAGGRAERRRAAKGRGRRRADPRSEARSESTAADGRPLTRVEARRAARAAKDSPAVVASRVVGELFISLGVLMLLFVTYQLWWTNVRADQIAGNETHKIQDDWAKGDRKPGAFEPGQGFAIIHIPKLDVVAPIAEGTSKEKVLDRGMVGHYGDGALRTAMPSAAQGNFALAGHRNTHGEPFRYINRLRKGDSIVVETQDAYYTYEMTSVLPQTSPSNVSVIGPVPPGSGFTKPGRYITLTTCTPEFTSTYRLIVWGKMVDERPRSKGKPDALVG